MKELGRDARALIDASRHGDDPTPADRQRLRAAIATGAALTGATAATAQAATVSGLLGGATAKAVGAVFLVVAASTGAALVFHPWRPATTNAPIPRPSADLDASPSGFQLPVDPVPPASFELAEPTDPAPAPAPARPGSPRPHQTLEAETRELRRVQTALHAANPSLALRLLERQTVRYAGGALGQERAAARILALCQLGRKGEGRAALRHFESTYPRSPLLERLLGACGGSG